MECVVKGIPFYYREFGEGTPILMIHGGTVDHRHMVSAFEPLFAERTGWRRIYPDLPGRGKTPGAEWMTNEDQMLDAVLAFTDQVIPEQPFAVTGASYGGLLCQGLIYRRPQMILGAAFIVPALDVKQEEREVPDRVVLVRDEALLSEVESHEVELLEVIATVHSREAVEWIRTDFFPAVEMADREFIDRIDSNSNGHFSFDVNELTEPFEKPVLFLCGKQDSVTGYADTWKILPNFPRASYVVLDRSGHLIGIEQETLFNELVLDWLNRVDESSR